MTDWIDELSPESRAQWDEFVDAFRREAVEKITGSAAFISLVPDGKGDVKFWAELGCAIMNNKPIIAVAMDGRDVPPKLRQLAEEVVETDIDTEAGGRAITSAIDRVIEREGEST